MSLRFPRSLTALVLLVAAAFCTTGCIKTNQKTTVGADGSGTLVWDASINLEKMKGLLEMAKSMGGGAEGGDTNDIDREFDAEKVKKDFGSQPGIELTKVESTESEDKLTKKIHIEAKFDNLENLYRGLGSMIMGEGGKATLEQKDGAWVLTRTMKGGGDDDAGAAEMMAPMMEMMKPYLEDMEMVVTMEFPTDVVETNGKHSGKSVTWTTNFANMTKPESTKPFVKFKAEGTTLKAFSNVEGKKPEGTGESIGEGK